MQVKNWEELKYKELLEPQLKNSIPKVENLYIAGEIKPQDLNSIAVVGSRKMTSYGKSVTDYFVSVLCKHFTIISGLMYGVDVQAHEATLNNGGRTLAILGYGFNYLPKIPYANKLANKIVDGKGAIISEFENEAPPDKWTFPRRNRIVAALSKAILIIEAAEKSGSLITADLAIEQGKDIFVVPGSIFNEQSKGKHNLIKEGAILVDSPYDILNFYGISANLTEKKFDSSNTQRLFNILNDDYISVDELVIKSKLNRENFILSLSELELEGYIEKDLLNRVKRKY